MNIELRQLAAAGAKVIQIEEPTIHFVACFHPDQTELLDFLVDAFNHEVDGLDDVELWIHTCWGNPNMQKVYTGESYANSIEIYLERLKGDVWTVEATENELAEIDLFKPYADRPQEEGRRRRGEPPHPPGRHAAGRRRAGAARAGGHPGRQADPVHRLRVRPAGVQPDRRVLQDDRRSRRRGTSSSRSSGSRSATCRRPTRPCRPTCFRTGSR